jgi:hypothetical protein
MFLLSNARLRRLAWLHPPAKPFSPKPRALDEVEELTLPDELFELAHAVAAELLIVKIDGAKSPSCDPGCRPPQIPDRLVPARTARWTPGIRSSERSRGSSAA